MEQKPLLRFRLLGVVLVISVFRAAVSQPSDGGVMADLKKGLVLPKGLWEESDYCSWSGVQCDKSNRVIRIQLKNRAPAIAGELPSSLSNLTELGYLELRQTSIGGPLPTLKGLGSLSTILISENNFTSIPSDFFEGLIMLQSVYLDKLPLAAWEIPVSLQDCSSLKNFSANSANIVGKIPEFINGTVFPNLANLHLSFNNIEGGFPPSLGSLATLETLWVNGQKNFSGTIEVLGSMKSLKQIWLNMNSLTGPIPDFSGFDFLWDLNLRDNQFTGPVPGSVMALKGLKVVNLTNNLLQGPVPVFDKSVEVDMINERNSFCLDAPGNCSDDVNILLSIAKSLGYPLVFAKDWKGNNPCGWQGIGCPQGKINVINFQNKDLTGTISPDFSLIASLQTLNLANNNLYGTIPMELTKLTELKVLDLSNNHLSGDIPPFKNVKVNVDNNPDIGKNKPFPPSPGTPSDAPHDPPPGGKDGGNTGGNPGESPSGAMHKKSTVPVGAIVAGVIVGVCVIFMIGLTTFCLCKKKHKYGKDPQPVVIHPHHSGSDLDMVKIAVAGPNVNFVGGSETFSRSSARTSDIHMAEAGSMVISIQVLKDVTDSFSKDRILGRGGFATVYRGDLQDGTKIAVKRMETGQMDSKGLNEFKSEIDVLNKVRHRHLVSLIGYCLDANERLLVYEYMPQGTLSRYLFNWDLEDLKPLDWTRRLIIALDVGRGVEYLHGLASQSFIHRDLKPSNILLGNDMRAKVADFGLVRLAPEGKNSIETRLAGTFGYLAPEYAATGRVTTKVDVFAFGVILMELITGRKALDESLPDESVHLVTWFRKMCGNTETYHQAIDTTIELNKETLESIGTVSELAGYCCSRDPQQRPDMGHVVNILSSLVEIWKPSETESDDRYSTDMKFSFAETLEKWEGQGTFSSSYVDTSSSSYLDTSSYIESTHTQSSQGGNVGMFSSISGR